jgi:hypothetical protein
MRQVMPHRNNIVAERGSCKTFLRADLPSWTDFPEVRQSGPPDRGYWNGN